MMNKKNKNWFTKGAKYTKILIDEKTSTFKKVLKDKKAQKEVKELI